MAATMPDANASQFDARWSREYRRGDDAVVSGSDSFRHYSGILESLCQAGAAPIDVLDVGCGTSRHFHRLRNMRRLVGIDISPHMIEQARAPVRASEISATSIELFSFFMTRSPFCESRVPGRKARTSFTRVRPSGRARA